MLKVKEFEMITDENLLEIEGGATYRLMSDPSQWGAALIEWWESIVS